VPDQRWAQIKDIFELAMDRDVSERDSLLAWKCGSDEDLRREVQSLLSAHDSTGAFLEDPYFQLKPFTKELERNGSLESGTRIGAYRVDAQIGHGGMGTVYLATRADDEFQKQVAIKLIRMGGNDEVAIRRFRNERQILASLEHPYVARLLDGGTTPEGIPYFVMEYVEGQSLIEYCQVCRLDEKKRLELFLKICSAVHYAHRRSIIHRDLKPSNILVQEDGTPKLLDFGIAKLLLAQENAEHTMETTLTGMRALTPAYASPEQLQGFPATVRSDIYSLGVILFELLTGERYTAIPFRQSLDASRANARFDSLHADMRALITKATNWEPERRYESAEDFAADVQLYLDESPVLAASAYTESYPAPALPGSVAILQLQMAEPDTTVNAYLGVGITDALITRLSRVGRIVVRPTSAVSKYAQSRDAIQAGRELQVRYVLEGRLRTLNNQVRVSVQLVSVESGSPVWAATIDEHADDLMKLEDSISEQVAQALIPQLTGEEQEQLRRRGTANPKAHELYLKGRWHRSRSVEQPEELTKSLVCFMEAIVEDPSYARAHAAVADYYVSLGIWGGLPPSESFAAAKEAASKALELDPTLAEAHTSFAMALWACDGALDEAEQHFHLAITRDPDYPDAHNFFGQLNTARNRPELAIAHLERACKLVPDSPQSVAALASCYYNSRQFDRALAVLSECHTLSSHSWFIREFMARCYLQLSDGKRALEEAGKAVELGDRVPSSLAVLAQAEAANGREQKAVALVKELDRLSETRYVSSYIRASAYLAVRKADRCFELLEKAVSERDWRANWLAVSPDWDSIRSEPRYHAVVARMPGLTPVDRLVATEQMYPAKRRSLALPIAVGIAALVLIAIFIAWRLGHSGVIHFQNTRVTRITSNGTATAAAISPDGNSIAYVSKEGKGFMLRVRQSGSDRSALLAPPSSDVLSTLAFTNDGKYVTFVSYAASEPGMRFIHMVPLSGASQPQVIGSFGGPVSLSRDAESIAFVTADDPKGRSELWVQRKDGSGKRLLASLAYPSRFTGSYAPAWSNDGRKIACGVESTDRQGFLYRIVSVDTRTGKMREVPSPRWQWTRDLAWTRDDSALAVIGQEQDSSFQQIWYLGYPNGEARRITNDLNDYWSVSLSRDSTSLVSVQVQTLSNVYLLKGEGPGVMPTQITSGSGRYFDLSWTADGRVLYASDSTGSADLWSMNADGSEQKQLAKITGRSYAPAASPDGKTIAFHSNKSGSWNIWKADADGGHPVQLTADTQDSNWPQFTRDSSAILYHHTGANGMWNIWKVPVSGGSPSQLTKTLTTHPTISPRDGTIACWYSTSVDHPRWQLAIIPPEGGEPIRTFDIAPTVVPDSNIRWTSSGEGVTFLDGRAGASNIWLQPLNGEPARPLTFFTSGQIYSFDWSRDGRLIFSRGMSVSDVVLIQNRHGR
jgi:serine/threonine protein kinase/Tol biopolymer transport system component/tetratricopeptide (TPR) repeat protein